MIKLSNGPANKANGEIAFSGGRGAMAIMNQYKAKLRHAIKLPSSSNRRSFNDVTFDKCR